MAIAISFLLGVFMAVLAFAMAAMARTCREQERAFYGWLARDKDGETWVHETEPEKDVESGQWVPKSGISSPVYPENFRSVRWTDKRATRVCLTLDMERRTDDD